MFFGHTAARQKSGMGFDAASVHQSSLLIVRTSYEHMTQYIILQSQIDIVM